VPMDARGRLAGTPLTASMILMVRNDKRAA
jgi:hypothetical protein